MTRLRLITWFVIAYLTAAFLWWARLLYTKNEESFRANLAYFELKDQNFRQTPDFELLVEKHQRQHYMIIGEGCAFICLLFVGLFQINKSYRRELGVAQQRRNFLLSITHELKSPIAGIQLILETLIKRDLEKPMADRLAKNGLKDTERLQMLVNDLLLAARLDDAWQPQDVAIDLGKLLDETVEKLKIRYPAADFRVKKTTENLWFEADRAAISSVFQNLLENAVKYSPESSPVEARLFEEKNGFGIAISDLGIGIPEAEKQRVFEKFYRIGNEDTRETKGTGLGLFIVNKIVKSYKGKIEISDNQPRGTVFTLVFPHKK